MPKLPSPMKPLSATTTASGCRDLRASYPASKLSAVVTSSPAAESFTLEFFASAACPFRNRKEKRCSQLVFGFYPNPTTVSIDNPLADGEADDTAECVEHREVVAGLEVAPFVEHAVVRQQGLVVFGDKPAITNDTGRVVDAILALFRITDHGGNPADRATKGIERRLDAHDELVAQQQVLGRVTRQRQLGKDDQVGLLLIPGTLGGSHDAPGVALDITHQQVQLGQCDA